MVHFNVPKMSAHGGELVLLGFISAVIGSVLIGVLATKAAGWDVAACLLVLQSIIGAVKDRWNNRSQDNATRMVANSQPVGSESGQPGGAGGAGGAGGEGGGKGGAGGDGAEG